MSNEKIFSVGGPVQANEGLYIRRNADDELLGLCQAGAFAYVLTPRQMGKTSLMEDTANQLAREGIKSIIVDLQRVGGDITREQWYYGILAEVERKARLKTSVARWWRELPSDLGMGQRLILFFKEVLLVEVPEPQKVVIFVDEIDSTLSLDFTDDFFTAIRAIYSSRPAEPDFRRLSFVLIGAATPTDLIRDPKRTPFNIGRRVDLTDFTYEEALPLAQGFNLPDDEAWRVLAWVLAWTNGHPYLTQRLCHAIARQGRSNWTEEEVAAVVNSTFFGERSSQDSNLRVVRDMLIHPARTPDLEGVLSTYSEVVRGKSPVADEEQSLVKSHLKLSGVVRREDKWLRVRNRIYREVFNEEWIREHIPVNWTKRLVRVAAALLLVGLLVSAFLAPYAWAQKSKAEAALIEAVNARGEAESALKRERIAKEQLEVAKEQLEEALMGERAATEEAEQKRKEAEEQGLLAQGAAKREAEARAQVEAQRKLAVADRDRAVSSEQVARQAQQISLASKLLLWSQSLHQNEMMVLLPPRAIISKEAYLQAEQAESQLGGSHEISEGTQFISVLALAYESLMSDVIRLPRPIATPFSAIKSGKTRLAFSRNGQSLTAFGKSESGQGILKVWDAAKGTVQDKPLSDSASVLAYYPEPGYAVTQSNNGRILFQHLLGGSKVELKGFVAVPLSKVDVSPRGDYVLIADNGGNNMTVGVWRTSDGVKVSEFSPGMVVETAFSPDGNYVYTVGPVGVLHIWDVGTGKEIPKPPSAAAEELKSVKKAIFSADRKHLAASNGSMVEVFDTSDPKAPKKLVRFKLSAYAAVRMVSESVLVISESGKYLVTDGDRMGTVTLWDVEGEREEVKLEYPEEDEDEVIAVEFSADEMSLATVASSAVRVWDLRYWRETYRVFNAEDKDKGKAEEFQALTALSPDGGLLATTTKSGLVRVWALSDDPKPLRKLLGDDKTEYFVKRHERYNISHDERDETAIQIWDADTGSAVATVDFKESVKYADASADGAYLVALTSKDEALALRVWRRSDGSVISWKLRGPFDGAVISDDGRYVVASGPGGAIHVWDVRKNEGKGEPVKELNAPGGVDNLEFVPHSHSLFALINFNGERRAGRLWRIPDGEPIGAEIATATEDQTGYGFSQNGKYLAMTSLDKKNVSVVETSTGAVVAKLSLPEGVTSLDISGDGKYIVTAVEDNSTLRVWAWQGQPRLVAEMSNATEGLFVSISRDGKYVASTIDNAARIWDISEPGRPREIARIQPEDRVRQEDRVALAMFSPNDEYLFTASKQWAYIWRWQPKELLCQVNDRLLQKDLELENWAKILTVEEMKRFFDPRQRPKPDCGATQ